MLERLHRPEVTIATHLKSQMVRPVLEASPIERTEAVLSYVETQARHKAYVIAEGPPIYLWPALPSHEWDSQAFTNGWRIVNELTNRIPKEKLRHYVLVDDLNYRPKDVNSDDFSDKTIELWQSSGVMRKSAIFSENDGSVVRFSETELAEEVGSTSCSVLDAAFNMRKVVDHMRDSGASAFVYPENLHTLMLLVVGPDSPEIKAEQLNMIQALYERLKKHPNFQRTSKDMIRKAISAMYHHVWLDRNGTPRDITHPIFVNNKFMLQPVGF